MTVRPYVAVIDGDESICRALGRLLHDAGFQPITFASAEGFLDEQGRVQFDCLLVDVQLGGITGLELHRRLTACQIRTPVVFTATEDEPGLRTEAMRGGCAAFFRKTDAGADIVAAIRSAIDKSSGHSLRLRP